MPKIKSYKFTVEKYFKISLDSTYLFFHLIIGISNKKYILIKN